MELKLRNFKLMIVEKGNAPVIAFLEYSLKESEFRILTTLSSLSNKIHSFYSTELNAKRQLFSVLNGLLRYITIILTEILNSDQSS